MEYAISPNFVVGASVIKINLKSGLSLYNSLQLAYNWPWKHLQVEIGTGS
jgi:hypothetical protein